MAPTIKTTGITQIIFDFCFGAGCEIGYEGGAETGVEIGVEGMGEEAPTRVASVFMTG